MLNCQSVECLLVGVLSSCVVWDVRYDNISGQYLVEPLSACHSPHWSLSSLNLQGDTSKYLQLGLHLSQDGKFLSSLSTMFYVSGDLVGLIQILQILLIVLKAPLRCHGPYLLMICICIMIALPKLLSQDVSYWARQSRTQICVKWEIWSDAGLCHSDHYLQLLWQCSRPAHSGAGGGGMATPEWRVGDPPAPVGPSEQVRLSEANGALWHLNDIFTCRTGSDGDYANHHVGPTDTNFQNITIQYNNFQKCVYFMNNFTFYLMRQMRHCMFASELLKS